MQQSIYTYVNEYNRKHALSLCWIIMQTTYSMCLTKWFRHSEWFSDLVWWDNFATNQKASCKRARYVCSQVSNTSRSFTHVSFGTSVRSLIRFFWAFFSAELWHHWVTFLTKCTINIVKSQDDTLITWSTWSVFFRIRIPHGRNVARHEHRIQISLKFSPCRWTFLVQ